MNKSISSKNIDYKEKNQQNFQTNKEYLYPGLRVGIIMPAFNEQMNIGKTLSLIPKNISEQLDVIVIDDGSTDNTYKIANQYNSIVLRHNLNKGNGAAIQTGLEFCKRKRYDIVIIIDADGQHEPKYIKDFIRPIVRDDYDYVIGNRFQYYYDMSIIKKVCSRIMSFLLSFILGQTISDGTNV